MAKVYILLSTTFFLFSCTFFTPSKDDYFQAVKAYWPAMQARWKSDAEFSERHAASFREGAAMERRMSSRFRQAKPSGRFTDVAQKSEIAAKAERWLSLSRLKSISNIRCVPADKLPGENCEMQVHLIGVDGKEEQLNGTWRFDVIDNKISIVGEV